MTEKKQDKFDALGQKLSPKKIYATLKCEKRKSEMSKSTPPDADAINKYFAKIGSVFAAEIKPIDKKLRLTESKTQWLRLPQIHKKLREF